MNNLKAFLLTILLLIMTTGCGLVDRAVQGVVFDQRVGGHLELAASANTLELASQELTIALENFKKENPTEGYTSILWRTPDEDVGFWVRNMEAALQELNELIAKGNVSNLEASNTLLKLRETLTNEGEHGTRLFIPDGISVFPHNKGYFWTLCLTLGIVPPSLFF